MVPRQLVIVLASLLAARASGEVQISTTAGYHPDLAFNGSRLGVIYEASNRYDLKLVTFDQDGGGISPEWVLAAGMPSRDAVLVWGEGAWAASWQADDALGVNAYFGTFDDAGTFQVGPMPITSYTNPNLKASYPTLVWTGSTYFIAWQHNPQVSGSVEVHLAGLDAVGNVTIPDRILAPAPNNGRPWLAWSDPLSTLGLTWIETSPGSENWIRVANVSPGGDLIGSVETISPGGTNSSQRLESGGSVMGGGCTSNVAGSTRDAYYSPLDTNLDPVASPIPVTTGTDHLRLGNLVWTGVGFVWPVQRYEPGGAMRLWLYRLSELGNVLEAGRLSDVYQAPVGSQEGPRGVFTGDGVGVVWEDHRTAFGYVYYEYVPTIEFIVGGGAGAANPSQVKSLSAFKGQTVIDFGPYASGYGANVAAGDVDGDQWDEVLTGPGPGPPYGPQVRGFTGVEESIAKVNFYAYGTLKYGTHVATGDLDGDGMKEIVTGPGPGIVFGPHVRAFNFDGGPVQSLPKVSFYAYGTLKYGAEVAGGNVDGDGFDELLTGPGPGGIFGAHLRGFDFDNMTVTSIPGLNAVVFPSFSGLLVGAGDITADGRAEILASAGPTATASSEVRAFSFNGGLLTQIGSVVPFAAPVAGGSHVAGGDLDLQGGVELVATPGFLSANPGRTRAYTWTGSAFQDLPAFDQDVYPGLGYGATCAVGNVGI